MKDEVMIHGALTYECEKCGKQWRMWLECGVGGCTEENKGKMCSKCTVKNSMPCPFMIGCACGELAKHIDWHKDIKLPHPVPIGDNMSYFQLDREGLKNKNPQACGIPIVRKKSRDLREDK